MLLMGKRKPKAADPKGRARERGAVRLLGVEVDAALLDAFDSFLADRKPRLSKRAAVEWMMERFLTEQGSWPTAKT